MKHVKCCNRESKYYRNFSGTGNPDHANANSEYRLCIEFSPPSASDGWREQISFHAELHRENKSRGIPAKKKLFNQPILTL